MDKEVILKLLDIIPQWLVVFGVFLFLLDKLCKNNIKIVTKQVAKWRVRDLKKNQVQDKRLDKIEETVLEGQKELKKVDSKIDIIINLLKK